MGGWHEPALGRTDVDSRHGLPDQGLSASVAGGHRQGGRDAVHVLQRFGVHAVVQAVGGCEVRCGILREPKKVLRGGRSRCLISVVNITIRAERDLEDIYGEIDAAEPDAARKWYEGLKRQILSLEELPNRCPVTPEKKTVRHLLYGHKPYVYRVIYRVIEKK